MRRIFVDLGTVFCLLVIGVALYRLSSSGFPLGLPARFENIIWVTAVTIIAICRSYMEHVLLLRPRGWLKIVEWVVILTSVHLILFWLDTVVTPQDTFVTVFAFGLSIFLLPSVVISAMAYSLLSTSLAKSSGRSTGVED